MRSSHLALSGILAILIAGAGCAHRTGSPTDMEYDMKAAPQPSAAIVPVPDEPFPPGTDKDPLEPPHVLYLDVPTYPVLARETRLEGDVLVELFITRNGEVDSARVVQSTNAIFDRAALNAAYRCRFEPGHIGDQPIQFRWMIPFEFSLNPSSEGPSSGEAASWKRQPEGLGGGVSPKLPPGSIREPR